MIIKIYCTANDTLKGVGLTLYEDLPFQLIVEGPNYVLFKNKNQMGLAYNSSFEAASTL